MSIFPAPDTETRDSFELLCGPSLQWLLVRIKMIGSGFLLIVLSGCRRTFASLVFGLLLLQSTIAPAQTSASSLLLLIDTSGSMGDPVGNGNSQIKIDAAKQAAIAAVDRAARNGAVEIAVLAFEGECADPVPRQTGFSSDFEALQRFIAGLQPGGGTPMAEAMLVANRFMQSEASANARDRMIVLLADCENDCGSIDDALSEMQAAGVIFRHETVGFGIAPNSGAESDLQDIATATDGTYHRAADADELGELLVQFIDTFSLIDMLGMFGGGVDRQASAGAPGDSEDASADAPSPLATTPQAASSQEDQGQVTSMLGQFQAPEPERTEGDFVYCSVSEFVAGIGDWYFTGVFSAGNDSTHGYIGEFYDYLYGQGLDADRLSWTCSVEPTRAEAEQALLRFIGNTERRGTAVVRTGWRPGAVVADADSFTPHPLEDFRIAVPASPYDVEVCIRDYECEDGDRVRVSVNGIEWMSEEIVNAWMCRTVPLGEGRHDIELFAINGTGFKGEVCSHADANTGKIRVTGADTQTQSWRHRGGAGSSAGIEVTVR